MNMIIIIVIVLIIIIIIISLGIGGGLGHFGVFEVGDVTEWSRDTIASLESILVARSKLSQFGHSRSENLGALDLVDIEDATFGSNSQSAAQVLVVLDSVSRQTIRIDLIGVDLSNKDLAISITNSSLVTIERIVRIDHVVGTP